MTSERADHDLAVRFRRRLGVERVGAVGDVLEIDDDRGHFACVRLSPVVGMQNAGSRDSVPRQPREKSSRAL